MTTQVDTSPMCVAREVARLIGEPVLELGGAKSPKVFGDTVKDFASRYGVHFSHVGVAPAELSDLIASLNWDAETTLNPKLFTAG